MALSLSHQERVYNIMNQITLSVRKIWNAWNIRAMVLLSLILQITLFIFGSRRRFSVKSWIIFTVWIAYLTADWLVTFALGKLTKAQLDSSNIISPTNQLRALWAPLLLLHLGGPDTITAYAYEDNKLWLRHLVGIVGQSVQVIYVVFLSWTGSWLSFLTFPIFLAGVIKNGERVFALINSAGVWQFEIIWKEVNLGGEYNNGRKWIQANQLFSAFSPNISNYISLREYFRVPGPDYATRLNHDAALLYNNWEFLENLDIIELFDIIEIELGFTFDVLYTKATITYTRLGRILRFISCFCSLSVLLVFFLVVFMEDKSCHCYVDISLTAVLLVGAVVLELFGITMLLPSDQTMLWILKHHEKNRLVWKIFKSFPWLFAVHKKKRYWSNSMGQFSLLSFCFKYHRPGKLSRILEMFGIDKMLSWLWPKSFVSVPQSLKVVIKELLSGPPITASRGEKVLEKLGCEELKWSCTESVFDESIITWHIATDICYHMSSDDLPNEAMRTSKILSDYIMYLLVMHPSMFLPAHHQESRLYELNQARNILTEFFREEGTLTNIRQDYGLFLRKGPDHSDQDAVSKAKRLAEDLIKKDNKWDVIQNVWVEMLFYAAINSEQAEHAQELRCGGQFLTHLWLLLLHKRVASQ